MLHSGSCEDTQPYLQLMLIASSAYFVFRVVSGGSEAETIVTCKTHRDTREHGVCGKVVDGRVPKQKNSKRKLVRS